MLRTFYLLIFTLLITSSWLHAESQEESASVLRVPLDYEAYLEPQTRTLITTDLNVKVIHVYKRMGDHFHQGDILIQLDDEVAKAMRDKAVAALDKARINLASKSTLLKDGIASYNEYVDAKAALANAQADLTLAERNLRDTKIIAPYNGRMVSVNVEEGEYPNQELHLKFKPLLEIVDDHILLAKVLIPARLLSHLRIGQIFAIVLNETGETIYATLIRIGAAIDPISSTVLVDASVDNSDGHLLGGMTGRATLEMYPARNVEKEAP